MSRLSEVFRDVGAFLRPIFRPADPAMLLVVLAAMFGLPLLIYLRILWLDS